MRSRILHGRRGSVGHVVRQVDQELSQAALGGGVVTKDGGKGSVSKGLGETLSKSFSGSTVVAQARIGISAVQMGVQKMSSPEKAAYNVLQKTDSLLLHQLGDHIAQNSTDCVESFVCRADICQANVVKQDFLNYENGDRLAQLGPGLHDPKAEWDDLGCQEEVNDI